MSEPTTYRRVPGAINGYRGRRLTRILEAEQLLLDEGALVPVEPTARFRLTGGDYGNFGYRIHAEEYRLDNDQGLMDAPYGMYLLIPDTAVGEETP